MTPVHKFEDAGFHPAMAKNIALCKYSVPTPIQQYCIPAIKSGHDLIAIAQTGKIIARLLFCFHLTDFGRLRQDGSIYRPNS